MDREQFWALIEAAKAATGGDCEQQAAQLVAALRERSVSDVLDYHHIHSWLMAQSYRLELWGAAYLINGGCSGDGFDYFRGWLLGQGHATWQAALHAPDSLASHPQVRARAPQRERLDTLDCEASWGVAHRAYQSLTGQELTGEVAALHPWPPELEEDWDPGEDWDFDDAAEMRRRYPRLWRSTAGRTRRQRRLDTQARWDVSSPACWPSDPPGDQRCKWRTDVVRSY